MARRVSWLVVGLYLAASNVCAALTRAPSTSSVLTWKASIERFFADPASKAERLKITLMEISRFDLQAPEVKAALAPLRERLERQVSSMLLGTTVIGSDRVDVERWAVLAGPLKPILSEATRKRIESVRKTYDLSDRINEIARRLQQGTFGWEDPAPVVAALPKERQKMYDLLSSAKANAQRVLLKDSRMLDATSGRVENLRAENGHIRFSVRGRNLTLDDPAVEIHPFSPGDIDKAAASLTAAGKALVKQLQDAKWRRSVVTLVAAIVMRQDLRGTIIDLWAEHGRIHLTLSEPLPEGGNLIRDFALAEIFGIK